MGCIREYSRSIHSHGFYDEVYGVFIPPIYLSIVYDYPGEVRVTDRGTELKYGREENPTVRVLERAIASLELGEDALAFNSGMAAIATIYLSHLRSGGRVLLPMEVYSTTAQLALYLSRFGVEVYRVPPETEDIVEAISTIKPHLVLTETITNPTVRVLDVNEVAKACREVSSTLIVDNTIATPVLVNPLRLGAHVVLHSLTKYIAGHGDVVGGIIVSNPNTISRLWNLRRMLGNIMQPFEAYLTLRGLKTLNLRFHRMCKNALEIAKFLQEHPKVLEVYYPGLPSSRYKSIADRLFKVRLYGSIVSFKVKGGKSDILKLLKRFKVIKPTTSFGTVETLISYPLISSSKTLEEEGARVNTGITENLLRLSVGLEDVEEIIEDLDCALSSLS